MNSKNYILVLWKCLQKGETLFLHNDPESKKESMEFKYTDSLVKKTFTK